MFWELADCFQSLNKYLLQHNPVSYVVSVLNGWDIKMLFRLDHCFCVKASSECWPGEGRRLMKAFYEGASFKNLHHENLNGFL